MLSGFAAYCDPSFWRDLEGEKYRVTGDTHAKTNREIRVSRLRHYLGRHSVCDNDARRDGPRRRLPFRAEGRNAAG
jgi:hypothetical protein